MYKRRIFGRRGPSARFRLPLGLVLVVLGIALCILIPSTPINLSNVNVSDKGLPTPLDTSTPAPQAHQGTYWATHLHLHTRGL